MVAVVSQNILEIIESNFKTDKDLLDKYHIASPCDAKTAAQVTVDDLQETQPDFLFYEIVDYDQNAQGKVVNERRVGFFGTESFKEDKFLTSFFIKPEYRKKEVVEKFWDLVGAAIGKRKYLTGVYAKNTRAINFLNKKGSMVMEGTNKKGDDYLVFELN